MQKGTKMFGVWRRLDEGQRWGIIGFVNGFSMGGAMTFAFLRLIGSI